METSTDCIPVIEQEYEPKLILPLFMHTVGLFYYLTYHFLPKLTFLIHIQYHSNKLYLKYNLYYRQKLFAFKCSN